MDQTIVIVLTATCNVVTTAALILNVSWFLCVLVNLDGGT